MSLEIQWMIIGMKASYIIISWSIFAFLSLYLSFYILFRERNWNKFLLETKQHQKYEEWKQAQKVINHG